MDVGRRYRDDFVWSKDRPSDWNQGLTYPGVQKSAWAKGAEAKANYCHRFYDLQPNLDKRQFAWARSRRRLRKKDFR